jgi:soluble lytic murein transglycosylase-like protein
MKKLARATALCLGMVLTVISLCGPARAAQDVHTVLSLSDIQTYRAIFSAQDSAHIEKADKLIAQLSDRSLMGYVLLQRYLLPRGYKSKLSELKAWMEEYADLPGADSIYKLAKRRAGKTRIATPEPIDQRGARYDEDAPATVTSAQGRSYDKQFRALAAKGKPEDAQAIWQGLGVSSTLPKSDIDVLGTYVTASYVAEGRDQAAQDMCAAIVAHADGGGSGCEWYAGLAAYRSGHYADAAAHFEALAQSSGAASHRVASAAFWAARSRMRAKDDAAALALFQRASSEPQTFYGALAARVVGRDNGQNFTEPTLDTQSFTALMKNPAAHRAMALWQVGRTDAVADELLRAFGEIDPTLDPAFAALARALNQPTMELKAAETATRQNVYLTSLYPVPAYQPQSGFKLDKALLFAIARQESRFNSDAVSTSGARGLMQLMPGTAAVLAGNSSLSRKNGERLNDPAYNLELGQTYLRKLLERENGNLFNLAAAYNAGPGNLDRWTAQQKTLDDPLLFVETLPASETRNYIKRVMLNLWMYEKIFGQEPKALEQTASGAWPVYSAPVGDLAALP